jgi:AraC-like DNA-binding protein
MGAMAEIPLPDGKTREKPRGNTFDAIHSQALTNFPELVRELHNNPDKLLSECNIASAEAGGRGPVLEYRAFVQLLAHCADRLDAPDFGMRLARRQRGGKVIGPVGVVMKNSQTVGQALGYCARHIHAYSLATRVRFRPDRARHILFVGLEILLDRPADTRQVIEHAVMLAHLNIADISSGMARARRVHFRHEAQAPLKAYRDAFGCEVRFGQEMDGFVLTEDDLLCRIGNPDEQVYEMATAFIDTHYPAAMPPLHARVRGLVVGHLGSSRCTSEHIAGELCLHPRTLQRRLRAEGMSFEGIKDEVRREVALRYLSQSDLPLMQVAEKLGYSEASVLSRSCYRWFTASPIQLRRAARTEAA